MGETYKTWYYTLGDPSSNAGAKPPLIILHGGPAIPNPYMAPHEDLHSSIDSSSNSDSGSLRPMIFYDQIGGGKSTHLSDKPAEFWSVDLFMDEFDVVLGHFGLLGENKKFDVLGHSWGGMLAADWASRSPVDRPSVKNLGKLILADSLASMALWEQSTNGLLDTHPEMREKLKELERDGKTESEEYQKLMQEFYEMHVCTLKPWPEELVAAFDAMFKDPSVYSTM